MATWFMLSVILTVAMPRLVNIAAIPVAILESAQVRLGRAGWCVADPLPATAT